MNKFDTDINVGNKILIDKQSAIDKFEPWLKVEGYSEGELNMLRAVIYELRTMPSAEPERKKGHWEIQTYEIPIMPGYSRELSNCVCSECGSEYSETSNYCPNCGADMECENNGCA